MRRKPKERVIYDNYSLADRFDDAKKYLEEECENINPSEDEVWNQIHLDDEICWKAELSLLKKFFYGETCIGFGAIGTWRGSYDGGVIFTDFEDFLYEAIKNCDYIKIYDTNGHLFIACTHHDSTNHFEVKKITDRGIEYLNNWEYEHSWNRKRSEEYIHSQIAKYYSTIPRFAEKVYGCKSVEFVK